MIDVEHTHPSSSRLARTPVPSEMEGSRHSTCGLQQEKRGGVCRPDPVLVLIPGGRAAAYILRTYIYYVVQTYLPA